MPTRRPRSRLVDDSASLGFSQVVTANQKYQLDGVRLCIIVRIEEQRPNDKAKSPVLFGLFFWRLSKVLHTGKGSHRQGDGRSVRSGWCSAHNSHSMRGIVFCHGGRTTWASAIQSIALCRCCRSDGRSGEAKKPLGGV